MLALTHPITWPWSWPLDLVGASVLGRRLPSHVRQHSALSTVSWRFDLRGAANTQQLWQQNFWSHRWNSLPVQLHNPDITYGLFQRQLKGHLFQEAWTWHSVTSDMWCHRKTLTYLPDGHWTPRACQSYNMTMVLTCGHDGQWMLKACQSYKLAMVLTFGSDSQWMPRACQSYNMTMVLTCGPDSK